jgi:hypothetical protein
MALRWNEIVGTTTAGVGHASVSVLSDVRMDRFV